MRPDDSAGCDLALCCIAIANAKPMPVPADTSAIADDAQEVARHYRPTTCLWILDEFRYQANHSIQL
jgi:hypothetical protein